MGPIIGAGLMEVHWSYIFWFLLAFNGANTLIFFIAAPETNEQTLLYWKAQRLRRITGNPNIVTKNEQERVPLMEVYSEMLKRGSKIIISEPIVLAMDIYQSLCYGVLYLWFESFPIAYKETYKFSSSALAASYNSINVGAIIGTAVYVFVLYELFTKKLLNNQPATPDVFLVMSLFGSINVTMSLFIFGWTVNPKIHWFPSLIGATLFGIGSLCLLQSTFNYLAMIYPRFVASVLGGNGLFRSMVAGTFPIYGRQMFVNLSVEDFPVAWGCSLLGFIFLVLTLVPILLRKYGYKLQRNSPYVN